MGALFGCQGRFLPVLIQGNAESVDALGAQIVHVPPPRVRGQDVFRGADFLQRIKEIVRKVKRKGKIFDKWAYGEFGAAVGEEKIVERIAEAIGVAIVNQTVNVAEREKSQRKGK